MQRTAQDWIVLAELTKQSASSVGIVMAFQFGPSLVLLPWTGLAADRLDRRKLLLITQSAQGALALGLGLLTVTGTVQLWHVYVFALLLGCVTAFDAPARQTFVSELVSDSLLSNAVALNSTSFNAARMIGPAVAGVLIAGVGTGWVFLINSASFVAVIAALLFLRVGALHRRPRAARKAGSLLEGFRYVRERPRLATVLAMLFLVMTFGINFPVFISSMAVGVFNAGSHQFGLLTSMLAVGSVVGALHAAGCAIRGLGCGSLWAALVSRRGRRVGLRGGAGRCCLPRAVPRAAVAPARRKARIRVAGRGRGGRSRTRGARAGSARGDEVAG